MEKSVRKTINAVMAGGIRRLLKKYFAIPRESPTTPAVHIKNNSSLKPIREVIYAAARHEAAPSMRLSRTAIYMGMPASTAAAAGRVCIAEARIVRIAHAAITRLLGIILPPVISVSRRTVATN